MMTNSITNVTIGIQDFVKCYIKMWVQLNFQPDNMLFGKLRPIAMERIKY